MCDVLRTFQKKKKKIRCDLVDKEKIGLIIKQGIRVKLTIRVGLKLGQIFASGLTLINKR